MSATGEPEPQMASREMVHEFRNLLAVIINYCELIAEETSDPEAVKNDLNEIRTAAERALALTDRIPVPPKHPPAGSADLAE
ncbi:MAG TPA: histidine kinase dimerization/phospho-acceptor domain-containing protein [Candidatus Dormibacteraeota bacterium]|nr:histidine kinase dimerization/phospho-acceptor domain-containing protein [Candidatus Dormibacteraeota bacterium]